MYEDLIGYLLGALEADEQRRIERELEVNPQLRQELERLRRCLEPLESLHGEHAPPSDLTQRTLDTLARHDPSHRVVPHSVASGMATAASEHAGSDRPRRYSVPDSIVLALVGLIAITLFLPALANSRFESRKLACQDHLRTIAWQLFRYCDQQPDRYYPFVPIRGNRAFAGFYAPVLYENQLLPVDCSLLVCPGAELASSASGPRLAPQEAAWRVPAFGELDGAAGTELYQMQSQAGGSYAYCVGYVEHGFYHPAKNNGRTYFPILADAPSLHLKGRQSANHGGRGQNICYDDGRVVFVTDLSQVRGDDPWRNADGFAEVGSSADDGVLLQSWMPPVNWHVESRQQVRVHPLFLR